AEVVIGLAAVVPAALPGVAVALPHQVTGMLAPRRIHVADGQDLDILRAEEAAQVVPVLDPHADEPKREPVMSGRLLIIAQAGARQDERQTGCRGGALHKFTARK